MLRRGYDTWPDPRHHLQARGHVEMVDREPARTGWRPRTSREFPINHLASPRGLPRHARAGGLPRGASCLARRAPSGRAPWSSRRRCSLRRARDPPVEPLAPRRRLGRDLLAGRVRRPGAVPSVPGDLPRGGGACGGAAAPRGNRARDGGADDHQPRNRGAEGALPRAAPGGRRDLVPGVLGARRGLGPRWRPHLRAARRRPLRARRAEGLVVRTRTSPTSASSSRDPTRTRSATPASRT